MDTPANRADRWYLVPLDATYEQEIVIKSSGPGFRTLREAADAARKPRNGNPFR